MYRGHPWWLHERVEEVSADELGLRFAEPASLEAMAHVQRTLRQELEGAGTDS